MNMYHKMAGHKWKKKIVHIYTSFVQWLLHLEVNQSMQQTWRRGYERDKNLVLTVKPVLSETYILWNIVYNETYPYFSLLFKIRILVLNIFFSTNLLLYICILQIRNQVWNDENNRGYKYDLAAINFISLVIPKIVCNIHMHRRQHLFIIEEETMKTEKFGL